MRDFSRTKFVRLAQARVVNWHSILDRSIDIPDTGLLIFGTNGSGKTSLEDAIQFAMFPNAREARFNSAAASSAFDRNLYGYVLQKVDDDTDGRPHYLHKQRTAYIALLWQRGDEKLCFIVGIECRDDMTMERVHATVSGVDDVRDIPFLSGERMCAKLEQIEHWVRRRGGHIHDKVDSYIKDLSDFQGSPHNDWPMLLKSAIGFKEINDATSFVRRFLGERPVDHESLLHTFESYENLRKAAERTERHITLLDAAVGDERFDNGRRLPNDRQPALVTYRHFRSLSLMYRIGQAAIPLRRAELDLLERRERLSLIEHEIDDLMLQQAQAKADRQTVIDSIAALDVELQRDGVLQSLKALDERIALATSAVAAAEEAQGKVRIYQRDARTLLPIVMSNEVRGAIREGLLDDEKTLCTADGMQAFNDFIDADAVDLRRANAFYERADRTEQQFSRALTLISGKDAELRSRLVQLDQEQAQLRRGRIRYPVGIESARTLFREKLGWADARPLAEMIDIPSGDEQWRHAVEAELAWARFAFVVPEHLFDRARELFEAYRDKGYADESGQRQKLYNVSIVDIGKIRNDRVTGREANSLATKVKADNQDAEDYIGYLLGRVECVYETARLRKFTRAITPDLFYYRGYRLSSHDADNIQLVIGAHARAIRLAEVERQIIGTQTEQRGLNEMHASVSRGASVLRNAVQQFLTFRTDVIVARERESRASQLAQLQGQRAQFTKSPKHQEKFAMRERLQADLEAAEELFAGVTRDINQREGAVDEIHREMNKDNARIEGAAEALDNCMRALAEDEGSRGKEMYEAELKRRVEAAGGETDEVLKIFLGTCERQMTENDRFASVARQEFTRIVTTYGVETGFSTPVSVDDPDPLFIELQRLRATTLPEQKRMLETKSREMREGVVQNVLHSLGARFTEVKRLIDEINVSTRSVETRLGRFILVPRLLDSKKDIHDLAMRSMTVLNFATLEHVDPQDQFLKSVDDFMRRLVDNPKDRNEICDYRTYFDFQVHSCPVGGDTFTPFRGTRKGGSGGERQVPFYVMTFALMDHLYKQGVRATSYMGRILLMDEVFHNMSDDNVRDVMSLANKLKLQIIMVTPGKLRTLAPLFGKTLQTAKDVIDPSYPTRFSEYTKDQLPQDLLDFAEYDESVPVAAGVD